MAGPVFHLPSVSWHTAPSLALGQRGQYVLTDRGEKGPPRRQHSGIPSWYGDELERLMGADGKEAYSLRTWSCFLNMAGMGGESRARSMKGWSRRVSCIDSNMEV